MPSPVVTTQNHPSESELAIGPNEPLANLHKWDKNGDGLVCVRSLGPSQEFDPDFDGEGPGNADIGVASSGFEREWTGAVVKDNNNPRHD